MKSFSVFRHFSGCAVDFRGDWLSRLLACWDGLVRLDKSWGTPQGRSVGLMRRSSCCDTPKSKDSMSESQSCRQHILLYSPHKSQRKLVWLPHQSPVPSFLLLQLFLSGTRCEVGSMNPRPSFLAFRLHRILLHFYFI